MPFEPTKDDVDVLSCFLHAETMAAAVEDTDLDVFVIKDILYHLFHHRYLKNVDGGILFHKDDLESTSFIITAKGYELLENIRA